MSCPHHLNALFGATARMVRKVNRAKRFDRTRAARPLVERMVEYWSGGLDALFEFLTETEAWEKIQQHVAVALAGEVVVEKALSDADRKLIVDLLSGYGYYSEIDEQAKAILEATTFETFEQAAVFALGQLGVKAADFELRNQQIMGRLLERKTATVFATRTHIAQAMDTVITNFYELGRNPYNQEFVDQIREDLNYQTDWEAKRFALTETGIAAEMAQVETYRRNGVTGKEWHILGQNTRPTHEALSGVAVGIDEKFDVGGYPADHPLDPHLPPEELVNCHCWLSPVISDDYAIDVDRIWEGA